MKFKRTTVLEKGKLDITPLIDVVFLLIIFFMLSSTFILQPGIKVNLPDSKVSDAQPEENIIVTITSEKTILLNDEKVDEESLSIKLRPIAKRTPERIVIIKADERVNHGLVVKIMGEIKDAGIKRLAIATKPKKDK
ncbi:MAG: biopolymer transporter ExbD [Candidatus Aureabacteria bacterium]|nr:biopolymer transporter ExbD [Candidatus Auribacterota bacterium]